MSGGWKEARDAAYKLAETRPSLFPVLFWLRCSDLASMLRSLGKAEPTGDFELYRELLALIRTLFALTNGMKYMRTTIDYEIFCETCCELDYLISKYIAFTAKTSKGNSAFRDEIQEKFVQVIRLLSCGGAGGKKYNNLVKTQMRSRVGNADAHVSQMRGLLDEISELLENASTPDSVEEMSLEEVVKEHAVDSAPSTGGEGPRDVEAEELVEEQTIRQDPHRNKPISVEVVCCLQWALQHGLFDSDPRHFVDSYDKLIEDPSEFVSLVDSSALNPELLALPTIGEDRSVDYVRSNYGPWRDQPRPRQGASRKTAVHQRARVNNGPTLGLQSSFRGNFTRNDRSMFSQLPSTTKEMEKLKQFIEARKTTRSVATVRKKIMGIKWLFTVESLVEELERVRSQHGKSKTSTMGRAISRVLPKEVMNPSTNKLKKKELAKMLVNLRNAGVPVSKELKEEQMETTVTIKNIRNKVMVTRREEGARTESRSVPTPSTRKEIFLRKRFSARRY